MMLTSACKYQVRHTIALSVIKSSYVLIKIVTAFTVKQCDLLGKYSLLGRNQDYLGLAICMAIAAKCQGEAGTTYH